MKDEVTKTDLLCYCSLYFMYKLLRFLDRVMLKEAVPCKSSLVSFNELCTIPRVLVVQEYQMLLSGTRTYSTFWNLNALMTNLLNVSFITAPWTMVNDN